MRQQFSVTGMTCGHCRQAVEQAVSRLDDVESVTVDLSAGRVTVGGHVTSDRVVEAIRAAGYAASPMAVA